MNKNIKICVKTLQTDGITEWKGKGLLQKEEGHFVILYEEKIGDLESSNRLEINANKMGLSRSGEINSDMLFKEREITQFEYRATNVNEKLELYTKTYQFEESGDKLGVNLEYEVHGFGELLNSIKMEIRVTGIL